MQLELPLHERQQLLSILKLKQVPRIHVLSDLHLECGPYELPAGLDFDILVAAGDIGHLDVAVPWLAALNKPVVYVLGNHERYQEDFLGALDKARQLAKDTQVHVLERGAVVIQGVRFLGATLWTDLRQKDPTFVHGVWSGLRDYSQIQVEQWLADQARLEALTRFCKREKLQMPAPFHKDGSMRLHPGITYLEHQASLRWLKRQLARDFDGFTVVVSHHAPSFESLRQHGISDDTLAVTRWGMRDIEPARIAGYASELLSRMDGMTRGAIDLWVHGHTHTAMDYVEHGVRVLTNPRGRPFGKLPDGDLADMHKLGYRFNQQRLDELRQRERDEPYAGDSSHFDATLVVDLLTAFERPFHKALAPLVERLEELCGELHELLPHTAASDSVPARCVDEAFVTRLDKVSALLEDAQARALKPLDQWAGHNVLGTLKSPYAPYLRMPWPGDPALTRDDYAKACRMTVEALNWTRGAHRLMRDRLLEWGRAARLTLETLENAKHPAQLAALPRAALRQCNRTDFHLQIDSPGNRDENEYEHVNVCEATALLERVLNGNHVPRKWTASFFLPEDARHHLLRAADLHHFTAAKESLCSR